jgi:hypothetical protein
VHAHPTVSVVDRVVVIGQTLNELSAFHSPQHAELAPEFTMWHLDSEANFAHFGRSPPVDQSESWLTFNRTDLPAL